MYFGCGRSAWWWWREGWDLLLRDLFVGRTRTALMGGGSAWFVSRGSDLIAHRFSCGQVRWGPPWLIEDSIHKVLGARISGGHTDVELVERGNELVKFRKGGIG
jgi:hypothetical protein